MAAKYQDNFVSGRPLNANDLDLIKELQKLNDSMLAFPLTGTAMRAAVECSACLSQLEKVLSHVDSARDLEANTPVLLVHAANRSSKAVNALKELLIAEIKTG